MWPYKCIETTDTLIACLGVHMYLFFMFLYPYQYHHHHFFEHIFTDKNISQLGKLMIK